MANAQIGFEGTKNGDTRRTRIRSPHFRLELVDTDKPRGQRIPILELLSNKLRRIQSAAELIRFAIAAMQPGEFWHLEIP